ncbi:unnamed protein product [Lactuca saligna]|uniref:Uncharacterized protein n=1 Tax=Lactuca saligna TaxID=75948 RepID=A0AA35Z5T7_LACSI|nr:unnamed protein product [Lactuca saligna]
MIFRFLYLYPHRLSLLYLSSDGKNPASTISLLPLPIVTPLRTITIVRSSHHTIQFRSFDFFHVLPFFYQTFFFHQSVCHMLHHLSFTNLFLHNTDHLQEIKAKLFFSISFASSISISIPLLPTGIVLQNSNNTVSSARRNYTLHHRSLRSLN